jgi:aminopeptidase N
MRNLTRAEAVARAGLLDVTSYDVELDLTVDERRFRSSTVVRFGCREPGATTFLELDAPELHEATLNGVPVQIEGNRMALPDLAADNEVRVVASCAYTKTGEGLHRFVDPSDGAVYLYAMAFLDDAQRFYACFDQPDLKAVFRLTVLAPPAWRVLSNMRGEQDGGRWSFAETPPISTYHLTLAAGDWVGEQVRYDGLELGVWCRRSLQPHLEAEELFDITRRAFAFQQAQFGSRYMFGDTYDQVFCPEFNAGAMENPGMVTYSDELFLFPSRVTEGSRRLRAQVMSHEMAHMWFGNQVTMRWWDDIWLNESFAELMGVLTVDEATPYDGVWADFCLGRKAWGYRADQLPTTHPVTGAVPDNRSGLLNFDGISYAKGASALRQLMAYLGREAFFTGVRGYLAEHAWGNTTLADLLAALQTASGRDLTTWADTWLRTPGVSTLRSVGQEQTVVHQESDVLREHRIGVGRYDLVNDVPVLRAREEVDVTGGATRLPGEPADLLLLNDGDLTFAKIRFDARSLTTVLAHLGDLADPLARAVCWGALWDATRDAELPAADHIGAVLRGAPAETDPALVETLLQQATLAASAYVPSGAGLRSQIADHCWNAALELPPGSDLQLTCVRAYVQATVDVPALEGLLDGGAPEGVVVDTELRWWVLRRLAVLGEVDEPRLTLELTRDRSDTALRHAEWSRAARPDAGSKEAVWNLLFGDSLSNAQVKALAGGFWQYGQDVVLEPYVDRYLAAVPGFWSEGTPQNARIATLLLFPSPLVRPDVLERVQAVLATDLVAGARRIVLEQSDDLRRALRARQAAPAG